MIGEQKGVIMTEVSRDQLKEILNKNWMTHDGMWFYHCLHECGIEKTNRINKAAVRSMALIEVKRVATLLKMDTVSDFGGFKALIDGLYGIVKADFMKFDYAFDSDNRFRMDMKQCFAYDGMKRIGAIEQYECGIFERVEGWFDGLDIRYGVTPAVKGCMMHTDGMCYREYRLDFGDQDIS
jgi:hypothetical protein